MMKVVVFKGGVGNQIFQYYVYKLLEKKGHKVFYKDETMRYMSHYGLELDKYFDVNIKELPFIHYNFLRVFRRLFPNRYTKATSTDINFEESSLLFDGYWHNKKFGIESSKINFKNKSLLSISDKNISVLTKIENTESVSLHVRRGDYLKPNCIEIFGNICTEEYYKEAISIIKDRIPNANFFIFSDDIEWCKNNLNIENAEYIDWNTENDSIYDMYLMSHCKANIIANSTFSYWAAKISNNYNVIYPKKWFANKPAPDMFPNKWIGL